MLGDILARIFLQYKLKLLDLETLQDDGSQRMYIQQGLRCSNHTRYYEL